MEMSGFLLGFHFGESVLSSERFSHFTSTPLLEIDRHLSRRSLTADIVVVGEEKLTVRRGDAAGVFFLAFETL